MISERLQRYLKSLDVSTDKQFKNELKKMESNNCMDQHDIKARVIQEDLMNWVKEVWYDDKISSEIINKPFKTEGIINVLDESKNEIFISYNQLIMTNKSWLNKLSSQKMSKMKNTEIDDNKNSLEENYKEEKEAIDIEFTVKKTDYDNNEIVIDIFDGRMYKEKTKKILLKLTWLRVYNSKQLRKFKSNN